MKKFFASFFVAAVSCISMAGAPSMVQAYQTNDTVPVGGHYNECHGYVLHISAANLRVHCIDGKPADLSFISLPKYAARKLHGKTVQDVALKPGVPVHVIYTHELGLRHAYKVFVADPRGHGLFGFKT